MKRFSCSIDGNRALSLARTANGGNLSAVLGQRRNRFPSGRYQGVPPILRSLLSAYAIHDI
jgi:hypothetical protein